jgi:DNA-directed RNA polymerase subunit RPC12/RpoP
MPTIFKKCPNCGKRFEVEHTGESVEKKTEVVTEERLITPPSMIVANSMTPLLNTPISNPPTVKVAELIEEDEYTEAYKCKHCGHVWTEKHEEVEDLGQVKGAGADR